MKIGHHALLIIMITLGLACARGGGPNVGKSRKDEGTGSTSQDKPKRPPEKAIKDATLDASQFEPLAPADWPTALLHTTKDGKRFGNLLCERGPAIVQRAQKANLDNIFNIICVEDTPTKVLGDIFANAYGGALAPQVQTIVYSMNDLFVTKLTYAFAIKTGLSSPAAFSGLPVFDELAKGLRTQNSLVYTRKVGEREFPGRGSVREVILEYDLPYGEGAALYDKRQTESNTYLLVEGTQDINMTVEHLLNPEENQFYNTSNGIVVGVKGEQGETYFVYVIELVLINRFDPGRVQRTVIEMAKLVQEAVLRVAQKGR